MKIDAKTLRELKEEKAFRQNKERYKYYIPNKKCEEYIKAIGSGDYFVTMFSAANGVGKTATSANVLANIVFDNANEYFDYPLYNNWKFPKKGRIVSYPSNVDNVIETLEHWLPDGKYEPKKKGKTFKSFWQAGEWSWDIMTTEQDPKEFEGPTLGWVWFDEIPPKPIYKAAVSRLRKGGLIFISATPLEGSGWLYDHILESGNEDEEFDELAKGQRINIEADVWSACSDIEGNRGHLKRVDIERMIAEYDEDEKQARVYGKFQHLAGLVFKQWSRKIHLINPFEVTLGQFCVYEMLDPHPRNEDAVLWVAVDNQLTKYVIDELYLSPLNGTEELANRIKAKASQYRIVRRLADPSAFNEDQHTGRSLATRLSEYGLNYLKATKARANADQRIKDALSYHQLPTGEFIKEPEVYFFNTLHRTPWEMEHYRWDEWSGKTGDNRDRKEKPVDKDDHMIENLGRCLIQEPKFVPQEFIVNNNQQDNYDPYA